MELCVFTNSTCESLIDFILQSGGDATDGAATTEAVKRVAGNDEAFARWWQSSKACEQLCDNFAARLLRCASWRRDDCESSQRLWKVANLAARLRKLELHFADELEEQKREAIYHFAYGISHELNNPLANIATRAGVLAQHESAVDRRQMLETIIDNAMRGSEMLGDLMLIARPPEMRIQSVAVSAWFEKLIERARKWASTREVTIAASDSAQANVAQFCPVAMNEAMWCLIRNAIEVSRAGDTIEVSMSTANGLLTWTVRDQGPGLSEKALQHCFDPYFSGREAGRGLGLGLSKAQMIATAHAGTLSIANRTTGGCEAVLQISVGEAA